MTSNDLKWPQIPSGVSKTSNGLQWPQTTFVALNWIFQVSSFEFSCPEIFFFFLVKFKLFKLEVLNSENRSDEVHIQKLLSFDLPGRAFGYNPFSFSAWGALLALQKKRCVYVITHLSSCHWTLLWSQTTPFFTGWKIMAFRIKTQGEPRKNERRFFQDEVRPTKNVIYPNILTSL